MEVSFIADSIPVYAHIWMKHMTSNASVFSQMWKNNPQQALLPYLCKYGYSGGLGDVFLDAVEFCLSDLAAGVAGFQHED